MAKQLINVGASPNDGSGDTLRSAGQKLNSMLNEIYDKLGEGTNILFDVQSASTSGQVLRSNGTAFTNAPLSYNDLTNRPSIPNPQVNSDWNATSGISQILNKPTLSDVATSGSYSDLLDTPILSDVAISGSYDDLLDKPSIFSGNYADLTNKPIIPVNVNDLSDVSIVSPTTGQVIKFDGTNWVNAQDDVASGSIGSSLQSRGTLTVSTGLIGNNFSSEVAAIGFKSYALMKIETTAAAWVTVYTSQTARTLDSGRSETTDPVPGSGVIAELITTGAAVQAMTPVPIGFNDDSTPSENIYLKIVNKSGSSASITVTLTVLQLEA